MSWRCVCNNTQTSHHDKQNILGSAAAYLCSELTVPRASICPTLSLSSLNVFLCTQVSCLMVYCPSPPPLFFCTGLIFHFYFFSSNVVFSDRTSPPLVLKLGSSSVVTWLSNPFPSAATCQPGSLAHVNSGTLCILRPLLLILSWLCLFSGFLEDIYLRLTNPCVLNSWVETMSQSNWPAHVC